MLNSQFLKDDERAILSLRALYGKYGYLPYKMSKFEEYDLYVKNKDFLVSDSVITFNDTNGKLLALKPDVKLSKTVQMKQAVSKRFTITKTFIEYGAQQSNSRKLCKQDLNA